MGVTGRVVRRNAALRSEIDLVCAGAGDALSLRRALRGAMLLVPRYGEDQVIAADEGGLRWVYAFTSERQLALFARQRGAGEAEVDYLSVRGDRLLDAVVPGLGGMAGVAIDVAGDRPMLLPLVDSEDAGRGAPAVGGAR